MEPCNISNPDSSESSLIFPAEQEINDFIFNGKKLFYVLDDTGTIWIRGTEITDILLYDNSGDAISTYVDVEDVAYFRDLKPKISGGSNNSATDDTKETAIFLNQIGIYSLVFYSKLIIVRQFIRWLVTVVVPSIEKLGRKSEQDSIAATNEALKRQIRANMLSAKRQRTDLEKLHRLVRCLKIDSRAKDAALEQQIYDGKVLQRQFQVLIVENRVKQDALQQNENDTAGIQRQIKVLEDELQNKTDLLDQQHAYMEEMSREKKILELTVKDKNEALTSQYTDTEKIVRHIQDLESRQQARDEELEKQINDMQKMQTDMVLLENENATLKNRADKQKSTAARCSKIMRTQDVMLHMMMKNFVPKPYDRKLEEEFIIFRLNVENLFTHYAVRIRIRNINQQIKIIQATYPNAVELLRIAHYPNTVSLFKLMRYNLKDKIQFRGCYFTVRKNEYTDEDLKNDVLELFREADQIRNDLFTMMDIQQYFKRVENTCESTAECADGDTECITDQHENKASRSPVET